MDPWSLVSIEALYEAICSEVLKSCFAKSPIVLMARLSAPTTLPSLPRLTPAASSPSFILPRAPKIPLALSRRVSPLWVSAFLALSICSSAISWFSRRLALSPSFSSFLALSFSYFSRLASAFLSSSSAFLRRCLWSSSSFSCRCLYSASIRFLSALVRPLAPSAFFFSFSALAASSSWRRFSSASLSFALPIST